MEPKSSSNFCSHQDNIDGYCKKCKIYICKECQMQIHFEHINEIDGLDSIFTAAAQEYTQMISVLDKQLISSRPKIHPQIVEESIFEVTAKIQAKYNEVINAIDQIQNYQIGIIKESPFIERLKIEKNKLEGEEMRKVEQFDEKLNETLRLLLKAIQDENYIQTVPMLNDRFKEELGEEATSLEPYYEQQKKFFNHIDTLRSVRPNIEYERDVVEDLIQIRGVHQQIMKLAVHCGKSNSIFIHIPETASIYKNLLNDMTIPIKAAQTVVQGEIVIICGGKAYDGKVINSTYAYYIDNDNMVCKNNMIEPRICHSAVSNNDSKVFVAGGFNDSEGLLKSCEMYDVCSDIWKRLPHMNIKRKNFSLCIIDTNKFLFALGGITDKINTNTEFIELLNLAKASEWELIKLNMPFVVSKAGCIQVEDFKILVFGGKNETNRINSVFEIDTQAWNITEIGKLPEPEEFNSRTEYRKQNGLLYCIPGNNIGTTLLYQMKYKKWGKMNKEEYLLRYNWDN